MAHQQAVSTVFASMSQYTSHKSEMLTVLWNDKTTYKTTIDRCRIPRQRPNHQGSARVMARDVGIEPLAKAGGARGMPGAQTCKLKKRNNHHIYLLDPFINVGTVNAPQRSTGVIIYSMARTLLSGVASSQLDT